MSTEPWYAVMRKEYYLYGYYFNTGSPIWVESGRLARVWADKEEAEVEAARMTRLGGEECRAEEYEP